MGEGWEAGEVVWPEGYDPENGDGDTLPISVGGKSVAGRDGDFLVGEELLLHSDDATVTLSPGQQAAARSWLKIMAGRSAQGLERPGWRSRQRFPLATSQILRGVACPNRDCAVGLERALGSKPTTFLRIGG